VKTRLLDSYGKLYKERNKLGQSLGYGGKKEEDYGRGSEEGKRLRITSKGRNGTDEKDQKANVTKG
jgi:hypothetical protein